VSRCEFVREWRRGDKRRSLIGRSRCEVAARAEYEGRMLCGIHHRTMILRAVRRPTPSSRRPDPKKE
jgi:hypothetical protein